MAVISRAAMQKILDERITMSACMKASNQKLAIEEILMACTSTLGVPEERNPNIHRDDPGIGSDWLMDPCRWPLSVNRVHHITMMLLCPSAGSKCIVHDTYATLFHRVFFPNTYNTIRESPLDAKSNDTTLGACISSCSNFPACKSWSFDSKNGCFINKDIPRSKWHHGGRSGVCSERYACGLTRDSKDHCTQNQPAFWRKRDNRTEAANAITRIVKRKTRMGGRFPFF